jgi:soluble P-type ATPase
MLEITIPDEPPLLLEHLVADFNGTLAVDGRLLPGVADDLRRLARRLSIHVITADTFGSARQALEGLPVRLKVLGETPHAAAKRRCVEDLGARRCVAIGNGRNDELMLAAAALGIVVIQGEGAARQTVQAADVVAPDIGSALGLLLHPDRLTATLRG